jgi:hypothetical protein
MWMTAREPASRFISQEMTHTFHRSAGVFTCSDTEVSQGVGDSPHRMARFQHFKLLTG